MNFIGAEASYAEADAVICISREEEKRLTALRTLRRVVYLPNGVNCGEFRLPPRCSPRREWGIPPDRRLVLCISRIDYQKNQKLLLALPAHDPQCHLLLVGPVTAPWYRDQIAEEAEPQNQDTVFDDTVFTVKVTVTDNKDGTLKVEKE